MSVDKRSRPSNGYAYRPIDVIDLCSDDEEPPRKRQKSLTPATNGIITADAKPIFKKKTTPGTPPSTHIVVNISDSDDQPISKKPSPFKNRPAWQKQTLSSQNAIGASRTASTYSKNVAQHINDAQKGIPDARNSRHASARDDRDDILRFKALSVSSSLPEAEQAQPRIKSDPDSTATHASEDIVNLEKEGELMLSKFKFHQSSPLKFNPAASVKPVAITGSTSGRDRYQSSFYPSVPKAQVNSIETNSTPVLDSKNALGTSKPAFKSDRQISVPLRLSPIGPRPISGPSISSTVTQGYNSSSGTTGQSQSQGLSINIPLSDQARQKQERKVLQERLKQDVGYAKDHPKDVERLLGLNGFSQEFTASIDEKEKLRKAAQPKQRVVDRHQISLDMGSNPSFRRSEFEMSQTHQLVHPKDQSKAILTTRFLESFIPPLTFTNSVNDRRLNGKFQFISEYILRKGVKSTGHIERTRCKCDRQCTDLCACLLRTHRDDKTKREWHEQVQQYERRSDGLVVLRDDFIRRYTITSEALVDNEKAQYNTNPRAERVEIVECNDYCTCDKSCINRVVQKGRTVPLEIFETARCGFGVRSSKKIVRGQFIELYLGEVITNDELNRREAAAEAGSTSYIYSLDWFDPPPQSRCHVDGENFGSAMRFVNHSCNPDAGTFTVLNDKSSKQIHHVAFFAIKDIPPGTEITIDYTPQAAGTTYELNEFDQGMERCYCGSSNCRQMLWLPGKERKARKKTVGKNFD